MAAPAKITTTVDDVYKAFVDAGADGLRMAAVTALHKTDPTRPRAVPTERAAAGRHLRALLDAGAVEPLGHGRWVATAGPDWRSGDPVPSTKPLPQGPRPEPSTPEAVDFDPDLLRYATDSERHALALYIIEHSDDWRLWIPALFPEAASKGFSPHHCEFWDHVWSIEAGTPATPFVACWPRGHGKSSSAEMAVVALACRRRRRYIWIVSSTQQLADEHVATIGTLLQSDIMQIAYPDLADRAVDKYGHSKAWRRNRLRTRDGFVVDALGLDTAARGMKVEHMRPDAFIFDDVDETEDTPSTTDKKIQAITRKILPAGAQNIAVLVAQNLPNTEGIVARLVSKGPPGPEPADFLANRVVSGPVPAVQGLTYEQRAQPDGSNRWVITGGTATWEGMPLTTCQVFIDTFGLFAFLAECQHEDPDLAGGWFDHVDWVGSVRIPEDELPALLRTIVVVDPAVTDTAKSDSCGVVVMALGSDRKFYVLWAWERIANPTTALTVAINVGIEYGAEYVIVETDQGGDTWQVVFNQARDQIVADLTKDNGGDIPDGLQIPRYDQAKAGSSGLSKRERIQRLIPEYDLGRIRHVEAGAVVLEKGLRRFPKFKPFDIADAAWHARNWLGKKGRGDLAFGGRVRTKASRGTLPQMNPGNLPGAHR